MSKHAPTKKSQTTPPSPTKSPPISTQLADLQSIIDWFHSDDFNLDEAATQYQQAVALAAQIEHDLTTLKNQITIIDRDFTKDSTH